MLLCSHAHASPQVALSGVPVCRGSLSGMGVPFPAVLCPPAVLHLPRLGPLATPAMGPYSSVCATHAVWGWGCAAVPAPPGHQGPLTDSSTPQYACWGAARGHWALRGHSSVPMMSPRAAVPDPPVCGHACSAWGVSVCLASSGFGAPFVCPEFARPCCSP